MAGPASVVCVDTVAVFAESATDCVVRALAVLAAGGLAVEAVGVRLLAVVAVAD